MQFQNFWRKFSKYENELATALKKKKYIFARIHIQGQAKTAGKTSLWTKSQTEVIKVTEIQAHASAGLISRHNQSLLRDLGE